MKFSLADILWEGIKELVHDESLAAARIAPEINALQSSEVGIFRSLKHFTTDCQGVFHLLFLILLVWVLWFYVGSLCEEGIKGALLLFFFLLESGCGLRSAHRLCTDALILVLVLQELGLSQLNLPGVVIKCRQLLDAKIKVCNNTTAFWFGSDLIFPDFARS